MTTSILTCLIAIIVLLRVFTQAFELPGSVRLPKADFLNSFGSVNSLAGKKKILLQTVSYTANGKSATPEKQAKVLDLVRDLETTYPSSPELLTNPAQARLLDGVWYLQYTSSSSIGKNSDQFPNAWKPNFADEGSNKIETHPFKAKGSVTAAGIRVDTANRVVRQTFDIANSRVYNDVTLNFGQVSVSGRFQQSSYVPTRAIVFFDDGELRLGSNLKINFSFLFQLLALVRQREASGWLDTTFVDKDVRIGRGNKGTMFVLTRDPNAVRP